MEAPEVEVTPAYLAEWFETQKHLGELKAKEAHMRGIIFAHYFKDPKEGTNTQELNDGTGAVIKATYALNRSVDIGALDALKATQAAEGYNGPKVNFDVVIKWKPEVSISKYRELTAEEQMFVDQALIIKPGAPQLEITIPKRAKAV